MKGGLSVDGVYHAVADGGALKATLSPLTRRFEAGAFHVVGGPSGVGKTTLLSVLSLAVRAAGGQIRHGETDLTALTAAEASRWRRRCVGMVFQATRLVGVMSAREHIALASRLRPAAPARAYERGLELLTAMGLGARLEDFPAQLSGGEKQRVALAQALCFNPSLVLADEPTAALDSANARLVGEILADYARGHDAVVICVSHDMALRELADQAFDLERL
jgi:putative ABC transport system ATP-binding protein